MGREVFWRSIRAAPLVPRPSIKLLGMGLPRSVWIQLNRLSQALKDSSHQCTDGDLLLLQSVSVVHEIKPQPMWFWNAHYIVPHGFLDLTESWMMKLNGWLNIIVAYIWKGSPTKRNIVVAVTTYQNVINKSFLSPSVICINLFLAMSRNILAARSTMRTVRTIIHSGLHYTSL